jgi:hypothetical protein
LQNFGWKLQEKISLGRPTYKWKDYYMINLKEIGYEDVDRLRTELCLLPTARPPLHNPGPRQIVVLQKHDHNLKSTLLGCDIVQPIRCLLTF